MTQEQTTYDTSEEQPEGVVFYTDGGSRPNGQYIGWGVHGYSYKNEVPKKGAGNPTHYPSAFGYIPKTDKKEGTNKTEITPIKYYDGYGCSLNFGTNNLAEILATKLATEKAIELKTKKLLIRTDSEYVIKGSNDWSHAWVRNGWKRQDGTTVPNANEWKQLLKNYDALRNNECEIKIEWVRGHSDFLGNNIADRLATVGVMASSNKEAREQFDTSAPEGYWKTNETKHPMFCFKTLFFTTLTSGQNPGEYFMGDQGNEEEFYGKRKSDGAYSVILLENPEPIVDLVRGYQTKLTGEFDNVVTLRLDHLFKHSVYSYIEKYGINALVRKFSNKIDLFTLDKEPLTRELVPPKLAHRAIDSLTRLKEILMDFKLEENLEKYNQIDITDYFYNKKESVKKKETITEVLLKEEIKSGFTSLPINIDIKDKTYKIILSLGIDLPPRNTLKKLECKNIKIRLIYWFESDNVVRYCTVVNYNNDIGVWAGFYSNMLFIK
jgi:ribonuclease HI